MIINCKRSHRQSSQIDKSTGKINDFLVDETQARSRSVDITYTPTRHFSFFAKENGKKRLEDTSFWRLSLNSTTMKLLLSSMGDFWLQMTNDRTTMDWVLLLKPFLWADRLIIRPLQTVSQWKGPFWDCSWQENLLEDQNIPFSIKNQSVLVFFVTFSSFYVCF